MIIRGLIFCIKGIYWMTIGWWLRPIMYARERKIKNMQEEITIAQYEELKKSQEHE